MPGISVKGRGHLLAGSFLRNRPVSTNRQVSRSPTAICASLADTALSIPPDTAHSTRPSPAFRADFFHGVMDDVIGVPERLHAADAAGEIMQNAAANPGRCAQSLYWMANSRSSSEKPMHCAPWRWRWRLAPSGRVRSARFFKHPFAARDARKQRDCFRKPQGYVVRPRPLQSRFRFRRPAFRTASRPPRPAPAQAGPLVR